jgi:hypothetical protein
MAIVQNPITGRTRKKFGTAVFSKQFDQNTMRTRPMQVNNPRTEGQVRQRERFAKIVELVKQVLPLINEVYAGKLTRMSPYNKVVSLNSKAAFIEGTSEIDYTKIRFSDIEGSTVSNVLMTMDADRVVNFTWDADTDVQDELDELVSVVLVNNIKNKALIYNGVAARSEGMASITAPSEWVGDIVSAHFITVDMSAAPNADGTIKGKKIVKYKVGSELADAIQ